MCAVHLHVNCVQWFEDKLQEIETLDLQLKKLYSSIETLVGNRKGALLEIVYSFEKDLH